jgi:hypothetical protein
MNHRVASEALALHSSGGDDLEAAWQRGSFSYRSLRLFLANFAVKGFLPAPAKSL